MSLPSLSKGLCVVLHDGVDHATLAAKQWAASPSWLEPSRSANEIFG